MHSLYIAFLHFSFSIKKVLILFFPSFFPASSLNCKLFETQCLLLSIACSKNNTVAGRLPVPLSGCV